MDAKPRFSWSFGSNRIQLGAEIKLLEEVLSAVDHDQVRGDHCVSALPQSGNTAGYAGRLRLPSVTAREYQSDVHFQAICL
jgi:hypothetical protein